ncbi:glycosyltransferase family 2 protein [Acetobacter conturbans]|nr:glycosyltransferase [Acetobacter conturbans]
MINDKKNTEIAICIPTYKRYKLLKKLISSINKNENTVIIVGNNDNVSVFEDHDFGEADREKFTEIFVTERGVTAVRNTLIQYCLTEFVNLQWVVFIDDDQVPSPDWLQELMKVAEKTKADLIGGPVAKVPSIETYWGEGATNTSYLPVKEGYVDMLNEGGNLAIATAFLRRLERKPFDPNFGKSGGEDFEFFLFAFKSGAKLAWAPKAEVTEIIPKDRLTLSGLVFRSLSTGMYQTKAEMKYNTKKDIFYRIMKRLLLLPAYTARDLLKYRRLNVCLSLFVRKLSSIVGACFGLCDLSISRYGQN